MKCGLDGTSGTLKVPVGAHVWLDSRTGGNEFRTCSLKIGHLGRWNALS